jgi:aminomuconate-semialdehyde/2-hydroxymuconate-6-semialdehyde dehydrogenase
MLRPFPLPLACSFVQPKLCNFIGGQWVAPSDGVSYLPNLNPATGALLCSIPASKRADVDQAVAAAKKALPAWAALSSEARASLLDKVADGIAARSDEMAALESEDSGKPLSLAKRIDVPRAEANFRFFAGAVRHDEVQATHMADAVNYSSRSPVGVCGLITPWNLPVYLLSWKVAPALAMGNTVVAKPSELTPRSANLLAEIIQKAGVPDGVFNIVHGYGGDAGQALCEHPDVDLISFTGGTATGRRVAATAAPMFKKLSLELGGKNATIVFADCDFEHTVKGAVRAAFTNQGQVCLAGSRIFVQEDIYDKFVQAMLEEIKTVRYSLSASLCSGKGMRVTECWRH